MKFTNARRLAAVAASALAAGVLVASGPAQAVAPGTGPIVYQCDIANGYKLGFTFDQDTNAPAKLYVGKPFTATYAATITFPDNLLNIARIFQVTSFDGSLDSTVLVNGAPIVVHAPMAKTNVPATGSLSLKATGVLPKVSRNAVASIVYKPGDIKFSVNAFKSDNSKLFGVSQAQCDKPTDAATNAKKLDTIGFVKSPTTIAATASYAKGAKKVTLISLVKASSQLVPTGSITAVLYKGTTKVGSKVVTLVNGKATAAFTSVKKKGAYKVVTTYAGSAANFGSSVTRTFTIK